MSDFPKLFTDDDHFDITRNARVERITAQAVDTTEEALQVIQTYDNGRFAHIAKKIRAYQELRDSILLGNYLNSLILDVEGDDPSKSNGKRGYPFRNGFPPKVMQAIMMLYNKKASVDPVEFTRSIWGVDDSGFFRS